MPRRRVRRSLSSALAEPVGPLAREASLEPLTFERAFGLASVASLRLLTLVTAARLAAHASPGPLRKVSGLRLAARARRARGLERRPKFVGGPRFNVVACAQGAQAGQRAPIRSAG